MCFCSVSTLYKKTLHEIAAEELFNDFIKSVGYQNKTHHDQGTEFENDLFHHLEQLTNIKRSATTPYHPMGNVQRKCFNQILFSMLFCLSDTQNRKGKTSWIKWYLLIVVQRMIPLISCHANCIPK